jgi:integrase
VGRRARIGGAIHPRFECLVWTAAASGLRFGELAGLTLEYVNLERRELRVIQALHDIKGQGPTLGPPKTESAVRTVPLAEVIANRLAVHIEQYVGSIERDELVFTSQSEWSTTRSGATAVGGIGTAATTGALIDMRSSSSRLRVPLDRRVAR